MPKPLILAAGTLFLIACAACTSSGPAAQAATATLPGCDEITPVPERGSILPAFAPSFPCQLEKVSRQVDFCMVRASSDLSYPCSQAESVQESIVGEGERSQLIQRDYVFSAGCWHGTTSDTRSLRACDRTSGESTTLAQDVLGDLVPSPDGVWLAFVAAEAGSHRLKPHIFRVRSDGTDLVQLDTGPLPLEPVVGAQVVRWQEDGEWLAVSLWDGGGSGFQSYRVRADGSGEFEALP